MLQPRSNGFRVAASLSSFPCIILLALCIIVRSDLNQEEDGSCSGEDPCALVGDSLANSVTSTVSSAFGERGAAVLSQLWPLLPPMGLSGVVGYACGLLAKKVIQVLILAVAAIVTVVQVLAYLGWVTVHWERISGDLAGLMGEGSRIGAEGIDAAKLLAIALENLSAVVAEGLPNAAGFATGLTLAFMPGMAII